ncbi:MAG: recombinase RecT [Bacteroidales bacterium]|jgi:recombinational DNA repair protein RecT|nr:recombinase RecT [Bacteroidales bacterium]
MKNFEIQDKKLLVEDPDIQASFIDTLCRIHKKSAGEAEMIFNREALYYKKALLDNEWLRKCTGLSLYSSFLDIAISGLSIQPGSKSEAFLEARSAKQLESKEEGGKIYQKEVWVKVCRLVVTAYGELNMRIACGQIVRLNNPIVIYEGDRFQPRTNERGELTVDYAPAIPRKSTKIIGVWCSIVLPNGGIDFKWLLKEDIHRLAEYSKPKNVENPQSSALYRSYDGQIDPGFLEAKCIKHAMRAYTKLHISDSITLEEDEQSEATPTGFASNETKERETVTVQQQPEEDPDMPY